MSEVEARPQPLISVIVPVYKVEKYLDQCVESIVNQTYKNLEIILVDDGSPDRCPQMCDVWASKDDRVVVIHQQNSGQSAARNLGMKVCHGDFIGFVDSDDWLEANMYEVLVGNLVSHHADISACGFYYAYDSKNEPSAQGSILISLNRSDALKYLCADRYFGRMTWDKIFKREILSNISFPNWHQGDDFYVTVQAMLRSCSMVYSSTPLYYYRQRSDSVTHKDILDVRFADVPESIITFAKANDKTLLPYAYYQSVLNCLWAYNLVLRVEKVQERKDLLGQLRKKIRNRFFTAFFKIDGNVCHPSPTCFLRLSMIALMPRVYKNIYLSYIRLKKC